MDDTITDAKRFQLIRAIAESHLDDDDYIDTGQVVEDLTTIARICRQALEILKREEKAE